MGGAGCPFEHDGITFVQDSFAATLDEVDLGAQQTRPDRRLVTERTEGLIEEIAADLRLPNPQAVLVLLDAVYFLGTWTTTFDANETREPPFQLADGSRVEVPKMHCTVTQRSRPRPVMGSRWPGFPTARTNGSRWRCCCPGQDVPFDDLLARLDVHAWPGSRQRTARPPQRRRC